jgi:hypothetical protein
LAEKEGEKEDKLIEKEERRERNKKKVQFIGQTGKDKKLKAEVVGKKETGPQAVRKSNRIVRVDEAKEGPASAPK